MTVELRRATRKSRSILEADSGTNLMVEAKLTRRNNCSYKSSKIVLRSTSLKIQPDALYEQKLDCFHERDPNIPLRQGARARPARLRLRCIGGWRGLDELLGHLHLIQ